MKPLDFARTFGHFAIAAIAFWVGVLLFSKDTRRSPASSKIEIHDLSGLNGSDFEDRAKERVLENLDLVRGSETYRIRFGHFYGPNRSTSMCETYKNIIMVLKAEGMAIHGEAPAVTITIPCQADKIANQTNEAVLPYKELTAEKPEDGEYDYNDIKILVKHLDGSWPADFYVDSISLMGLQNLHVDLEKIRQIRRGNITLRW